MKDILKMLIEKFFSIRILTALLCGLVTSLLLILSVGTLAGAYKFQKEPPWLVITPVYEEKNSIATQSKSDNAIVKSIEVMGMRFSAITLFIITFVFLTILIYIFIKSEREDIFTPVRKRLRGHWRVEYEYWDFDTSGNEIIKNKAEEFDIKIDDITQKLFILAKNTEDDMYESSSAKITDIGINTTCHPKRLTYYHEFMVPLKAQVREILKDQQNEIKIPVFCVLYFPEDDGDQELKFLQGTWYDLQGIHTQLREQWARQHGLPVDEHLPQMGKMSFSRP